MRDESGLLDDRIEAAKAAAPYVHPRLANVQLQGDKDKPLTFSREPMSKEQWIKKFGATVIRA